MPTIKSDAKIHPLVRDILKSRGLTKPADIENFLYPDYERDLHDPFLLTDMKPAVDRILEAVKQKQSIVIYGDYDIDGITATALLLDTIANLGHVATGYIPDRFEEGYGINLDALKKLKADGVDLIISVDCGVTSVSEIDWANKNGLDIIITDHHNVPAEIPKTLVINPKRPGDKYPFKDLAGVGVAFKLAQALQTISGLPAAGHEKWLLDLVALGTVCDVVPLVGENRVLARYGLVVANKSRRPGIKALAAAGGVTTSDLNSYHFGWVLGPRLNAAGRLEHAAKGLQLITTADAKQAATIAGELNELNRQRIADQQRILAAATQQAAQYKDDPVLVLADPEWSHGVVGIVAGRLVDKFRKPTLVLQIMDDTAKGSARSTAGFNIVEGLAAGSQYLIKYGGHYFAAGCTLKSADISNLRKAINNYYLSLKLDIKTDDLKQPDLQLPDLAVLDWEFQNQLDLLEPHGHGNPKPMLAAPLTVHSARAVGKDQTHLKLELGDNGGRVLGAIGFSIANDFKHLKAGSPVTATFQLVKNDYMGNTSLELLISQLKDE